MCRRRLSFETLDPRNLLTAFSVVSSTIEVGEADGATSVTVYVDDHGSNTVTVDYATAPGTAFANQDYQTTNGRLTFAPTDFSKVVPVTIINDLAIEGDETFTLTLSSPSAGCTINPDLPQTGITIVDNDFAGDPGDPQPEINVLDGQMIVADESGLVDFGHTTVNNPLRRTFTVENQGSATLSLANPTTLPAGFSLYAGLGTLSLAPLTSTSFTVQLDATTAGTYTGELSLGNNDNPNDGDSEDPYYNFTIQGVVDGAGSVSLSVNDVNVQEGGTATFTITISRALVSGEQVTVAFATADGTAENVFDCSDYTATSGSLTFLPGQALTKTVNVVTHQDPVPEDDEDFFLNLSNLTGATFYNSQGRGVILNDDGAPDNDVQLLVTAPDAGNTIDLHFYDANQHEDGPVVTIDAYTNFYGGVRVATGDINGDGFPDVITGAGSTGGPHVKTFDGRTGAALPISFFAYSSNFTGGIYVAAGDVNGDGIDDIITGAGAGGGPDVKVFDGATGTQLKEWFAFASNFTGGVQVAAGDLNGDGLAEVITGAGPGGGPDVRTWSVTGATPVMLSDFFPYAANFSGGVYVAAGDLNGDGIADVVTGAGAGGGPHVKAFPGLSTTASLANYFAYPSTVTMGVRVAVGDTLGNGTSQIITPPGPGAGSHVRMFDQPYSLLCGFFAYPAPMTQGVYTAAGKPMLNLTAYTPQTKPFIQREVPASRETSPGVGIRRNGDDDNGDSATDAGQESVAGEDDLIKVQLDVGTRIPAHYYLKRSNNNIAVWSTPNKQTGTRILDPQYSERLVPFSSSVSSFTYWVEWTDVGPGASGTQSVLTLEARSIATGAVLKSTTINFVPFNSIVVVLGGQGQDPSDPTIPNYGTFQSAIDLYRDGYDVHMYRESEVTTAGGTPYEEIKTAVKYRGVTQVAIFGYSQGGGATLILSYALATYASQIGTFTVPYTAYIDAVQHTGSQAEYRIPSGSLYHVNYWQSKPSGVLGLKGTSIPTAQVNIDVRTDASIDDDINVRNAIKNSLKTKVPTF